MTSDEISTKIVEKEKELLMHREAYATVKGQMLELDRKITELKSELSPLKIAIYQSRSAKDRIRTEIEILKNLYWKSK